MSLKPFKQFKQELLTDGSMAGNLTSTSKNLDEVVGYAIHFIWSDGATPVGSLQIEVSNDDTNYTAVTDSVFALSGDSGNYMVNVEFPRYSYVRAVYTRSSGSGTLNINIVGKIH